MADKDTPSPEPRGGASAPGMPKADQSANVLSMPDLPPIARDLVDALDEPSLVVEGGIVRLANDPARDLLGASIEGRDVRLAIRHPQVLERIANPDSGDIEVTGLAEVGRTWRLVIRALDSGAVLVRLFDLSAAVSAEKMRVDFVANASHELRTPLSTVLGYAETLGEEGDLPADVRTGFGPSTLAPIRVSRQEGLLAVSEYGI